VAFEQLGRGEESCVAMIERFQMGLMKRSRTYRAEESFPTPSARPYKAWPRCCNGSETSIGDLALDRVRLGADLCGLPRYHDDLLGPLYGLA
jgi:hypothetical protein